ncbi:hypothetical protein NDU88_005187 [Pleurodeles waltl]|uniref:Uncharacterized protein n=1 Tax=Pleurodeles waltl TaxID=8319 RepID=A0AAV7UJ49_PLEWA|nr:hypothetical protein NDU88_005187 [Pleurodeles waltl]
MGSAVRPESMFSFWERVPGDSVSAFLQHLSRRTLRWTQALGVEALGAVKWSSVPRFCSLWFVCPPLLVLYLRGASELCTLFHAYIYFQAREECVRGTKSTS